MKAAFLVENGLCEIHLNQSSKVLKELGFDIRLISPEKNIVKGWNERDKPKSSSWGGCFAVDTLLNECLVSNYDALVIPGGTRSINKLKNDSSVRRFISSFLESGKVVIAYDQAIDLLIFNGLVPGYSVASQRIRLQGHSDLSVSRCIPSPEFVVSKNLITMSAYIDEESRLVEAVRAISNGEIYIGDGVTAGDMSCLHKTANVVA